MTVQPWYYAKDDMRYGPVSAAELKQLASGGQLRLGDLVWREGMEEWVEARKVKGLFDTDTLATPVEGPSEERTPAPDGQARTAGRPGHAPPRHAFDLLIEFARTQFTSQFIQLTSRIFTRAGHYGLYLAMALLLACCVWVGVKTDRLETIVLGVGAVVILVVLQYTAARCFGALERLNRRTPSRLAWPALLDCFALFHMVGGLAVLVGLTVIAVDQGLFLLILPAVAAFILFQYAAILALNPAALGVTIVPAATAGEEALGVVALFVKLTLKMVPVAFGVGVVAGAIALGCALLLVFLPPEVSGPMLGPLAPAANVLAETSPDAAHLRASAEAWPAGVTASAATVVLVASAALPFFTYVLFLSCLFVVDVTSSVLVLPGKLDALLVEEGTEGEEEEKEEDRRAMKDEG
jgi:hypothetical protein